MAIDLTDAVWILTSVALRKSIYIFEEFAVMLINFVPVLVSTIRFSRFIFSHPTPVSAGRRYSPMSSMVARHDR
ncbi:hypothetical protein I3842_09G221300 [Carya illinoinensis]|uniref:Uncharacterized protein n=1 Tax=Carya illinoinensis TaxID=32201 RepID=A0A922J9C9_CARIL|nr:hypothetical protein I3842_09G221300 [Carya illinoinensis]